MEAFERAAEAGTKVYDVKTHMYAKFERRRRHDIRRSSGLDDPWSCGGCMCDLAFVVRWHTRVSEGDYTMVYLFVLQIGRFFAFRFASSSFPHSVYLAAPRALLRLDVFGSSGEFSVYASRA